MFRSDVKRCRECKKEFQVSSRFLGHVITHLYEDWNVPEIGPYICNEEKCVNVEISNKKKYIIHLGTIHKQLEIKLVFSHYY